MRLKRREEVEEFLNEIGTERVVSVTETGTLSDFEIVVWYEDDE